jgi:hypothetical protein
LGKYRSQTIVRTDFLINTVVNRLVCPLDMIKQPLAPKSGQKAFFRMDIKKISRLKNLQNLVNAAFDTGWGRAGTTMQEQHICHP